MHSSDVGVGGGGYFVHCYIVLLVLVVAEGNLKPELREIICAHRPPALTVGDLLNLHFKTIFSPTFILKEQACLLLSMKLMLVQIAFTAHINLFSFYVSKFEQSKIQDPTPRS